MNIHSAEYAAAQQSYGHAFDRAMGACKPLVEAIELLNAARVKLRGDCETAVEIIDSVISNEIEQQIKQYCDDASRIHNTEIDWDDVVKAVLHSRLETSAKLFGF